MRSVLDCGSPLPLSSGTSKTRWQHVSRKAGSDKTREKFTGVSRSGCQLVFYGEQNFFHAVLISIMGREVVRRKSARGLPLSHACGQHAQRQIKRARRRLEQTGQVFVFPAKNKSASTMFQFNRGASGCAVEKRQRAGAVQDAGADFCGFHVREASWTAVALYRSYGRTRNGR
jgi:hypothetical protein